MKSDLIGVLTPLMVEVAISIIVYPNAHNKMSRCLWILSNLKKLMFVGVFFMSYTILYSIGFRLTRVILMFMLSHRVFLSLLLMDVLLSTAAFPNLFYIFCFGANGGSTFLNSSLIFSYASPSVRGTPLLLRL